MSKRAIARNVLKGAIDSPKTKGRPYILMPKDKARKLLATIDQYHTMMDEQQGYIEALEAKLRDLGEIL